MSLGKDDLLRGGSVPVVIPGGCTSVLQPLDASLNKPFKGHIWTAWFAFMEKSVTEQENEQEEAELSDDPFTSSDEKDTNDKIRQLLTKKATSIIIKPACRQTIIDWVQFAWKKIGDQPAMVALRATFNYGKTSGFTGT